MHGDVGALNAASGGDGDAFVDGEVPLEAGAPANEALS